VLSNAWTYIIQDPNFIAAAAYLPFTTWFLTYLPIISFFTGLIGGIIFYGRKRSAANVGNSFNVDFDNNEGGGL